MIEFTLKQLEVFTAIVEYGSFSHAAEELFLTQSSVSAHLMTLEKLLGTPLIDRSSRRKTTLTPEGARLYPAAKKILTACEEVLPLFQKAEQEEIVPLAASTVPGKYLLPQYLADFLAADPDFRYTLTRGDSADVHRQLADGEIRIGFVGAISDPETVEHFPLAEDRLVMVTPNNHLYQKMKKAGLYGKDLLGEPTVAREIGSGTDRTARNYMQNIGFPVEDQNIVARVDDPESIKRMVAAGSGVSILSSMAVSEEVANGTLLSFDMDQNGLRRNIYLATPRDAEFTPMEQKLVRFIKNRPLS